MEAKKMVTSLTTEAAGTAIGDDEEDAMLPKVHRTQIGIFPPEIDFRFPLRKPIHRA